MASWTYSDWVTLTGAARLSRLKLHVQEVSDEIGHSYSVADRSVQKQRMLDYYNSLVGKLAKLGATGRVSYAVRQLEA